MHDMILLSFVHFTRRFLNPTFIKRVSIFAAIVLFGFSGYFGYEFIKQVMTFISKSIVLINLNRVVIR